MLSFFSLKKSASGINLVIEIKFKMTLNGISQNAGFRSPILQSTQTGSEENLNARPRNEDPICLAASKNQWRDVESLLKLGADSNACNADGKTALYYALQAKDVAAVELLFQYGANPD